MAQRIAKCPASGRVSLDGLALSCGFSVERVTERVTGIEPALSAWEMACHAALTGMLQVSRHTRLSVSDRWIPFLTLLSGAQRARCPLLTI